MTTDDWRLLGAWLRARRLEQGLTATTVARLLDADTSHVCSVELARYAVSVDVLDRWLRLLGIDLLACIGAR